MSVTTEQIQWAAYYCNLQTQGQQLSPEQVQWAFWYRQNYPPQQQNSPIPSASPSSGYGVPAAASTEVTAATVKTNPGFLRLNMQQKGLVLRFVEALPELNQTFQEITGNPNFKVTFDVTNFGHPHHPKVEEYHRTSGYSYGPDKFTKEVTSFFFSSSFLPTSFFLILFCRFLRNFKPISPGIWGSLLISRIPIFGHLFSVVGE
jgi:hypothetical protein